MFKRPLILATLYLFACRLALGAVQVSDDTGREVSLAQPAQRIVSLAPHVTELLFAAGAGEAVVGVVSHSDYPPEAARLRRVGDAGNLDVETIIALQPDLVVAWRSGNPSHLTERLIRFGVPVFYSEPRRLEDIATNLERLGRLAGRGEVAAAAAEEFRTGTRRLAERYAHATSVRVFYQIWPKPLITVGGNHLITQIIRLCGGHNVFTDLDVLAAPVDREAVLALDPEVIIASGAANQRPPRLDRWRDWSHLSAVKHEQLYSLPADLIQRNTPRVLEGARRLCGQLERARVARNGAPGKD